MLKTCKLCENKYENTWSNWYNKYYCKNCFKILEPKFKIGEYVYSYENFKKNGVVDCRTARCKIINIYKGTFSNNGIYQYAVQFNDKTSYRFVHQIFLTEQECDNFVYKTNKRRQLIRQAKQLMEE